MALINIILAVSIIAITAIFFLPVKLKGMSVLFVVLSNAVISSIVAVNVLINTEFSLILTGTIPFGEVGVKLDALSAWFILTINFTVVTSALYGLQYMKQYVSQKSSITMHCVAFVLIHLSMLAITVVQNAMVFLMFWELMALSAFVLVIFEHHKPKTIRAGLNYLIQSHVSIVFLMIGFIYVAFKTGSYNFSSITEFSSTQPVLAGTLLFLFFFVGFALKAGFVPFHTWLPYAHPVAPSHISGLMSGVVIKIGIYGILRMILLIKLDFVSIGYIILFVSLLSGIYGVMLAIIQHNLKRLLAYHSIENIGIIGIGIGVGCIGIGLGNHGMAVLGFSGALLHTLNHSLFKSALFYAAGNVYQSAHTMNIEKLGGVIKKMPQTSIVFLISAVAICGIPPLNGFISEFLIYGGIFNWLSGTGLVSMIVVGFSLLSLVFIGGMAVLCFTKAYSIVFLGNARHADTSNMHESSVLQLFPLYLSTVLIILIGIFPSLFLHILQKPLFLFTGGYQSTQIIGFDATTSLYKINYLSLGLIVFVVLILLLRRLLTRNREKIISATWGCAYPVSTANMQYTASSYIRSYTKLAKPLLDIGKSELGITEVFPTKKQYETRPYDKIERYLIDKPLKLIKRILAWFLFLQNGRLQAYILYGIVFILLVICIPLFIDKIMLFLKMLNHL